MGLVWLIDNGIDRFGIVFLFYSERRRYEYHEAFKVICSAGL